MNNLYTLIIPTFNRSDKIKVFLRFLEAQSFDYPILIADSSELPHRQINKDFIKNSSLNIEYKEFDCQLSPFQKFYLATTTVKTPFCSLCADDDAICTNSIAEIISFLNHNSDYSASHGYYYSFVTDPQNVINDLCYRGPSNVNDDPIYRLEALFTNYEALTYAIYRTNILRDIFKRVLEIDTLLGHELLAGALTVAAGKVARLPVVYMGRSSGPSHAYSNWHPVEMLFSNPDKLYQAYNQYRHILSSFILEQKGIGYSKEAILKSIDFIHFSYVSEFLTAPIMKYLLDKTMSNSSLSDTMQGLWPIIIEAQNKKLTEGKKVIERQPLYKTFFRDTSDSNSRKEFRKKSFLFGCTFINKLDETANEHFDQYVENISDHIENYLIFQKEII